MQFLKKNASSGKLSYFDASVTLKVDAIKHVQVQGRVTFSNVGRVALISTDLTN